MAVTLAELAAVSTNKLVQGFINELISLITSQNVTAPKLVIPIITPGNRLITSQNVTAPKHVLYWIKR